MEKAKDCIFDSWLVKDYKREREKKKSKGRHKKEECFPLVCLSNFPKQNFYFLCFFPLKWVVMNMEDPMGTQENK